MATPYPVKWFASSMGGAPTLNGTAGSLIAVLDACLVNGFNLKSVDTLTSTNGVATVTINSGHQFEPDQIVLISGCDQNEYNGEKKVISVTTTTLTFAVSGTPASPATTSSTISCKAAPLGWKKTYSNTNLAVYRSGDLLSTRMLLRVDDTGAQNARVDRAHHPSGAGNRAQRFILAARARRRGYAVIGPQHI